MRDFISALWQPAHGYGELRFILHGGAEPAIARGFIDLDGRAPDKAWELAAEYDHNGWDAYLGVLRRARRGGKAEDVVDTASVLWADIDGYKGASADFTTLSFPLPPSIIVDSGHGQHAYWLLRQAVPTADVVLANKGIAKDIGGDHTHDPARILRIPGTLNHKDPLNPVPVRLLRFDTTRRYRFSDFSEWLDKGVSSNRGTPSGWTNTYQSRRDLPEWLDELIANGAERGRRSEQCFKACVWLARCGYTDDEIQQVFASSPLGIGAKYVERGDRWLTTTINAAREAA